MKTLLRVLALAACVSATSLAQQTVADWQAKAIEAYPDLGVPDSPLNKTFLQLHQQLKETTPQLFDNPRWPFLIALLVGGDPKPQPPTLPFYVVVTTEYKWSDGLASPAGEVEQVIDIENGNYVLWVPTGVRYKLPKSHAQVLTDAEASARLLAQRQSLYAERTQIYTALIAAAQQQAQAAQSQASTDQTRQALELLQMMQTLKGGRSGGGPTQYNGRPLPRNWIDPKQADTNYFLQQLQNKLNR